MTDSCANFRKADRCISDLEVLECMAQEELANHFSCLKAMLTSLRPDFMADCADEYRESVVRKCKMGFDVAMPVVLSLHGLQVAGQDTTDGEIRE